MRRPVEPADLAPLAGSFAKSPGDPAPDPRPERPPRIEPAPANSNAQHPRRRERQEPATPGPRAERPQHSQPLDSLGEPSPNPHGPGRAPSAGRPPSSAAPETDRRPTPRAGQAPLAPARIDAAREPALPIEPALPELWAALQAAGVAVLQAPPGAGKTTRVPLYLLERGQGGRILLLEPRRVAARAAAERLAAALGETPGGAVGYRIRGESAPGRRIEVVTEGVLTRMLQSDPDLPGVGCVIFDEFHERALQADLGLALTLEVREALRPDLRLIVMSATLDAAPVAALLGDAPLITAQGRAWPVETRWLDRPWTRPGAGGPRFEAAAADLVRTALAETNGGVLVFLPGQAEIARVATALAPHLGRDVALQPLHGGLPFARQRAALAPLEGGRKLVLATAIAETSLTIPDVRVVVDAGRARRARFDPASGMSRLITERVTRAEAEQRRGRAGRTAPGWCYRLWTRGEDGALAAYPPPEIAAADLAGLALDLAAWGTAEASRMAFLTPPPAAALAEARALLAALGALDAAGRITDHGRALARLPLHPRLGHMLLEAARRGAADLGADLAALLGARDPVRGQGGRAPTDLGLRLKALRDPRAAEADHLVALDRRALDAIRTEAGRLRALARGFAVPDPSPGPTLSPRRSDLGLSPERPGSAARLSSGRPGPTLPRESAASGLRPETAASRLSSGPPNRDFFPDPDPSPKAVRGQPAGDARPGVPPTGALRNLPPGAAYPEAGLHLTGGVDPGTPSPHRTGALRGVSRQAPPGGAPQGAGLSPGAAVSLAYPDRIGQRRPGPAPRFLLSGGKGAVLPEADPLAPAPLIVAPELDGDPREAAIRLALPVTEAEIRDLHAARLTRETICEWSRRDRTVRARARLNLGALALEDRPWTTAPPDALAAAMIAGVRDLGLDALGWTPSARRLRDRIEWLRAQDKLMPGSPQGAPAASAPARGASHPPWPNLSKPGSDRSPPDDMPSGSTCDSAAPGQAGPERTMPNQTAPGRATSGRSLPDRFAPDHGPEPAATAGHLHSADPDRPEFDGGLPDCSDAGLLDTIEDWLAPHLAGITRADQLGRVDLAAALLARLDWPARRRLDALAPSEIVAPTGTRLPIDYGAASPTASVRLQELFGLTRHPTVGPAGLPLVLELLSPAQRPVQTTADLPSFWATSYAEVRRDLRGRYPRHPWPEDPATADPTRRVKPRGT